jgi:putative serine/threonine protein kinase
LTETIPLDHIRGEKYCRVLCYPSFDLEESERRLEELKGLGVTAVEFTGGKTVFNLSVLGKGCVGIVVKAYVEKKRVALKIRRMDAGRSGMQREAGMLERANAVNVGPKLLDATENFLLMELIEGKLFPEWIEKNRRLSVIRRVLRDVLEQGWRLDEAGLDHGELSRAPKHIIIDLKSNSRILDFETASTSRKVSNVTSMCNFLFIEGYVAQMLKRKIGIIDRAKLLEALRGYKQERNRERFKQVLDTFKLSKSFITFDNVY